VIVKGEEMAFNNILAAVTTALGLVGSWARRFASAGAGWDASLMPE